MARSILFFDATVMAVMCSAAFPAMGRMINPMKASESGVSATMASIVLVRKKAEMETRAEAVRRSVSEAGRLMLVEIEEGWAAR
jgi:hypothetical protein